MREHINININIFMEKTLDQISLVYVKFLNSFYKDERKRLEKYLKFSLGGKRNVVSIKSYKNGLFIVFYDFSKVKYRNFKNFGARVFISDFSSMILRPKYDSSPRIGNLFSPEMLMYFDSISKKDKIQKK